MGTDAVFDLGALDTLQKIVGALIALAGAITLMWAAQHQERVVSTEEFGEARKVSIVATAVAIALMFTFAADSKGLDVIPGVAIGCIVCCLTFFVWNYWLRHSKGGVSRKVAYISTLIVYMTCGSVGLSAAGLGLYVRQANPANRSDSRSGAGPRSYEVVADVTGRRTTAQVGKPLPFRASSGQTNFGCEQTTGATAQWSLPPGSRIEGEVKAEWVNVANASFHRAAPAVQPDKVIATGTIRGLDFQRIGLLVGSVANCPGGGHGELVVSGSYVSAVQNIEDFNEKLRGQLENAAELRTLQLTLPAADIQIDSIRVHLVQNGQPVDFAVVQGAGTEPKQSDKKQFTAAIAGGQLVVRLQ